jgi:hypothetical protein
VAVARTLLVIVHHLLARAEPCRDLGSASSEERERRAVERLETPGYRAALGPLTPAPPPARAA